MGYHMGSCLRAPVDKFLHTFIFLSYNILCIVSDMYSAPYKRITSSTFILYCLLFWKTNHTPYNRLSGQQMLSGTQIISTSHGMTGRNFFDVFLPFYLLFGL